MSIKLQAIIKKELSAIPEGFTGTILKCHTVIDIANKLPPEFDYLRASIHAESGTGRTNSGYSQIITDLNGNRIPYFKLVTSGEGKFSCGWINVSLPFIQIVVNRNGDNIETTIKKLSLVTSEEFSPHCDVFKEEKQFSFNGHFSISILPSFLEKYQTALNAAIDKSYCYHCHCLHFYR